LVAKVLVDVKAKAVNKLYDYLIPQDLETVLEIGMRVIVPFGSREVMGFVLAIDQKQEYASTIKPITRILDLESYITSELIELAYLLEKDTSTVLINVLETMLPSALKAVYKTNIEVIDESLLSEPLKSVFGDHRMIPFTQEYSVYAKEIKAALHDGTIIQRYDISSKSNPKTKKIVLFKSEMPKYKNEKQKSVMEFLLLQPQKQIDYSNLLQSMHVSASVIASLVKVGVVSLIDEEEYREIQSIQKPIFKDVVLNDEQAAAFINIMDHIHEYKTFLLYGVTGSGKTEIYIKAIEKVLSDGKEVLFLVPEIALTPMMVNRFKSHFKNQVAILHSGLSIGEKYDEWRKIIRKQVSIVIGARSAAFAPFTNLGLIIVDECHESTYKQDDMPAYYAIDVLSHRAEKYNVPLILGSATPNIESYARYKRGYYELLTLSKRALNSFEPDIQIVDMKNEFKSGNDSVFSNSLRYEMNQRLEKHEQVILLLNRRGYSNFVICRNCGHVFTCKDCDISLTYHETDHTLKCHYCGNKEDVPKECPNCKSSDLRFMGSGTQKVETELFKLFPNANVVRMDNDTTRTKNAHEKLLVSFETEGDILLGTQMIAKGLDFPRVTLVGILQADGNLYSPDFRAPEKTFQLITQVAGRAGRHDLKGMVIVQAFNPEHYAIRYAINHDYIGFYNYEMQLRKIAKYSPFFFVNQIMLSGENVRDVFLTGREIIKYLRTELTNEAIILGPTLPVVSRIKNKYRCVIMLKFRNEPNLNNALSKIKEDYETDHIYVSIDKYPTI